MVTIINNLIVSIKLTFVNCGYCVFSPLKYMVDWIMKIKSSLDQQHDRAADSLQCANISVVKSVRVRRNI